MWQKDHLQTVRPAVIKKEESSDVTSSGMNLSK